jgi:hypothetical protein
MFRLSQERAAFWATIAKWASRALGVAAIFIGVLAKAKDSYPDLLQKFPDLAKVHDEAWWLLPTILILLPTVDWIRRWTERKTLWPIVKAILDDFRSRLFPTNGDPSHYHRATLFRRCAWVWRKKSLRSPGRGWVKVYERSGHTTQNSRTVFRAPNDPDKATGVAGTTWAWNRMVIVENLPNLETSPTSENFIEYAQRSNCPEKDIRELRPRSRSLCGIPIEVKGSLWGVLVIDSRSPTLPTDAIQTHHPMAAKFLAKVLEQLR